MTEEERLVDGYLFTKYKALITEDILQIIKRGYLKKGYCFYIIQMLIDTMVKINNTTIEEAEKHFLEIAERLKKK